jgi:hypothetical protein
VLGEAPGKGFVELRLNVDPKIYEAVSKLAQSLNTTVSDVTLALLDILAEYSNDIAGLGRDLAVSDDKRAVSTLEELVYYGIESWRNIVNTLLDIVKARGCYELESLDFEPLEPLIEVEMVALEGCRYKADKLSLAWSPKGVILEVYYYLEPGVKPGLHITLAYEWSYLPDEHAVVISVTASSIAQIPPLEDIEREAEKLKI